MTIESSRKGDFVQRRKSLLVDFWYLSIPSWKRLRASRSFTLFLAARPGRCDLRRGKEDRSTAWRFRFEAQARGREVSGKKQETGKKVGTVGLGRNDVRVWNKRAAASDVD